MKELFLEEIQNGQILTGIMVGIGSVVQQKDKNYNPYYDVELVDMSKVVKAKIWHDRFDRVEQKAIEPGTVVKVSGKVSEFRGELQIIIEDLFSVPEDQYDIADFMRKSVYDLDEMWKKLEVYIEKIEDESIKKLIDNCISKYGEQIKKAPAAERLHHGFMGGMVEHILELMKVMESVKPLYPEANYDLVTAGIFFHDIGKIRELGFNGFSIQRTLEGKLIGHITSSYEIFLESLPKDFDPELKIKIGHIILSHHGILEYGSPVVPKMIEAIIVHELDDLSSTVRQFKRVIDESDDDAEFSKKDWAIGTEVYLK